MTRFRVAGLVLALALAACGAPVPTGGGGGGATGEMDGQIYLDGNTYRTLAVEELPIAGVTTDSAQSGLTGARAIDGDLATQWSNGGYRNATAWAAVRLAARSAIASVAVKTGPMPAGTSYDLQVSDDGTSWKTVASGLTNTTWNLETKALPAGTAGAHVRLFWHNSASAPQAHFAIYELVVNGDTGPAPSPTPAPTQTPSTAPTPTPTPTATATPGGTAVALTPVGATASSTYASLAAGRAIDHDLATQWSNGGYREAEAWLAVRFAEPHAFSRVALKTGALSAGVRYVIEASDNGVAWHPISGELTNTTWNMESKAVSGSGLELRVRFLNSAGAPAARFQLFELEVYGEGAATSGNRAPVITGVTQDLYKSPDHLTVAGSDPDGDALSYTWRHEDGSVFGQGATVAYSGGGSASSGGDEPITVTAQDGHGGSTVFHYTVDNFGGSYGTYAAKDAVEWDPAIAAYASLTGNVTITAGGDFTAYNGVIVEYSTADGRHLAIAGPGTITLPAVTGNVWMYLVGPKGADAVQPRIQLTLSAPGQSVTRTITQANVVAPLGVGLQMDLGPGEPETLLEDFTARNGDKPYHELVWMFYDGYTTRQYPDQPLTGRIDYTVVKPGDSVYGYDERLANGDAWGSALFFTDSKGGAADNTGAIGMYQIYTD